MSALSSEFQEYLADDEPVVTGAFGTLIDRSNRWDGSIGVTDRRVLFLSDQERFMDFSYDAIDSIQSHLTTTITRRAIGYWAVLSVGVSIAVVAVLGLLLIESSGLAVGLIFVSIGGTISAEYVRRHGIGGTWTGRSSIRERLSSKFDNSGRFRRYAGTPGGGDTRESVVLALGLVASTALIGLVALTESLLVIPLVLLTLCGIALTDGVNRWKRVLDMNGGNRRSERAVSIHLTNGRIIHLRVDAATRIDYEISGLARETRRDHTSIEWPDSSSDRSGSNPSTTRAAR